MYQSRFIFDLGAHWDRDWSQTDFIDDRAARLGTFTRLDSPHSGAATGSRWRGTQNTLTIVRDEQEHVVDLHRAVNEAPLGGADGLITRQLRDRAEQASHQLPPLVNVFYRPEELRFSYAFGRHAVGPGGMRGGLRSVPAELAEQPLLTLKVPIHINTPPGMSSIDAELVFYIAIRAEHGRLDFNVIGAAHPWRFHGDGFGAFQNEINAGLEGFTSGARSAVDQMLRERLALPAREVYLVPGRAHSRLEDGQPLRDQVNRFMTLVRIT